ncbi:MAG: hypothetical protein ACHQNA_11315 [Acidimicrobiales bacterium]
MTFGPGATGWDAVSALLQRGVFCPLAARSSVHEFLTAQLGIDPAYVRDRIATVFVNGSVVDDLETTPLRPGSTLTLSAAMPGLVGATLRKGGFYAAMRSQISWKADDEAPLPLDGPADTVRVKLFNTVLQEIGPHLLRRGVLIDRADAAGALQAWCRDRDDVPGTRWVTLRVASR